MPPARAAVPLLVLPLLLTACGLGGDDRPTADPSLAPVPVGSPSAETAPSLEPASSAGLDRFYDQRLVWKDCPGGRCTTVRVPLDYAEPRARTIELSVLKVPAADPGRRVGALVVNPGGPGGSGVDYASGAASYFGTELLAAFDVVGFDPRGVGRSTPVQCLSDERLDAFVASDPDPDTSAEVSESADLIAEFGAGCVASSGALAGHVSTEEAARDIDVLRSALGDERLSYFGASYGTFLGATYADLFPDRVGRMVLDGALDPSVSSLELALTQAEGFETALRAYVGACVEDGDCFLGDTVDAGTRRVRGILDDIDADPLPAGDRSLEVGNAVLGVWAPLYNEANWPTLDVALSSAVEGDGRVLLRLSDAYTSRDADGYRDNSIEALYAINCLDHRDAVPLAEAAGYVPRFEQVSPTFGAIFAYSLAGCADWPVGTGRRPSEITAAGAAPILVVGTTRDPATPLVWAEALADQLESGVLVRRDGDGHTGYRAGNACVDTAVESYLVSGTVPEATVDC